MMRDPQSVGENDEIRIGHRGNAERIGSTQGGPDIHRVLAPAEARDTLFESRLFLLESLDRERRGVMKKRQGRGTETHYTVVGEELRPADQATMFAAHGAPDQGPILAVELLDAAVGLDDLGPRDADASLLRHRERGAAAGDQAASA